MKIAIIGAGIGGLTLALALKRKNISCEIFEAAKEIQAVGAGIWIPPNAMNVFDELQIGNELRKQGFLLKQITVRDYKNGIISNLQGQMLCKNFGNFSLSIERSKLHSCLADFLTTIPINLNEKIDFVKENEDHIILKTRNQKEHLFDLVIASDGLNSFVRKSLFASNRPLRYSGQTCLRGLLPFNEIPELKEDSVEFWGQGLRFGLSPVGNHRYYWYATIQQSPGTQLSMEEKRDLLKNSFNDFPFYLRSFIEKICILSNQNEIIQTDLWDLTPGDIWVKNQIALVGDAAHATTPNLGQGAAMAIEDAFVLANELETSLQNNSFNKKEQIIQALKSYQQKRIKRVQFIVNTSWKIGQLANIKNPFLSRLVRFTLAKTPQFFLNQQLNLIYKKEAPASKRGF